MITQLNDNAYYYSIALHFIISTLTIIPNRTYLNEIEVIHAVGMEGKTFKTIKGLCIHKCLKIVKKSLVTYKKIEENEILVLLNNPKITKIQNKTDSQMYKVNDDNYNELYPFYLPYCNSSFCPTLLDEFTPNKIQEYIEVKNSNIIKILNGDILLRIYLDIIEYYHNSLINNSLFITVIMSIYYTTLINCDNSYLQRFNSIGLNNILLQYTEKDHISKFYNKFLEKTHSNKIIEKKETQQNVNEQIKKLRDKKFQKLTNNNVFL